MLEFEKLKLEPLTPRDKMTRLLSLVSSSYIHIPAQPYLIKPWDNWWLWLRGQLNPKYLQSQDVDFLWRRGAGFCDQAAMIFVGKAKELGFKARLVWLGGHVISEVVIPDAGARLVDADLGILWEADSSALGNELSQASVQARLEKQGYSKELAQKIALAYTSAEDNKFSGFPYLPKLYRAERQAHWIVWVIPFVLLIISRLTRRCELNSESS